ncbi:Calx-beta domain-containing protein [Roseibacillus ishigakijimensis]|uniref:Calx-beta domain-containing protein n=1 Tax=Roseibacillus ishigakijimensis TaxID=454146 RepID=A0A934VKZ9_9BACT|nr:Calx-beta domain-containing protein [Roseibacillus ishigakijimensis]MBK1832606.1 hypothetical protein [Roseibacillus ishigakijimensis]
MIPHSLSFGLGLLVLAFGVSPSRGAELARESFDDTPGDNWGYTVGPEPEFDDGLYDFFTVLPNDGSRFAVLGESEDNFVFAVEDLDATVTPAGTLAWVQTSGFDLNSSTNTWVEIRLAAPGDSAGVAGAFTAFDNPTEYDFGGAGNEQFTDRLIVEYSADGVTFSEVVRFHGESHNGLLTRSDTFPGVQLSADLGGSDFSLLSFPVTPGPAATVRVSFFSNSSGEFFALDSIAVQGDPAVMARPGIAGFDDSELVYTEGDGPVLLAPAVSLSDADSPTLQQARIWFETGFQETEDILAATSTGALGEEDIVFSVDSGELTIAGPAPLADFQALLRTLTYENSESTNPALPHRRLALEVTDDQGNRSLTRFRPLTLVNPYQIHSLPFEESFESEGQGVRYLAAGLLGDPTDDDIFGRVEPNLPGLDGSFAFAGEDISLAEPLEHIDFLLDGSGQSNLTLDLLVAAPDGTNYDSGDFIEARVSEDGENWTTVGAFHARSAKGNPVGGTVLAEDLDLNGSGDVDGTVLGASFQNFQFALPEAGVFHLRLVLQSNANHERLLVDHLRVTAEPVEISIADASADENEDSLIFTLTRSGPGGEITVDYSTAAGTALAGDDFTAVTEGEATFAAGELTTTVAIPLLDDSMVERDETFTLTLANASAGTLTDVQATGTIRNDDSASLELTVAPSSVIERDTGTSTATFTVSVTAPLDVDLEISRSLGDGATATAGEDYAAWPASNLFLAAGTTSTSFQVTIYSDHLTEGNESIPLTIAAVDTKERALLAGTLARTLLILDDDPAFNVPPRSLGFVDGLSAKIRLADLLAGVSGGEEGREFSLVGYSELATSDDGSSLIESEGWLIFTPGNPHNGNSFTYTVSDGYQEFSNTVSFFPGNLELGRTSNLFPPEVTEAGTVVRGAGIPGRRYRLQASSSLQFWENIGEVVTCPVGGIMTFTDPPPQEDFVFYRLIEAPEAP